MSSHGCHCRRCRHPPSPPPPRRAIAGVASFAVKTELRRSCCAPPLASPDSTTGWNGRRAIRFDTPRKIAAVNIFAGLTRLQHCLPSIRSLYNRSLALLPPSMAESTFGVDSRVSLALIKRGIATSRYRGALKRDIETQKPADSHPILNAKRATSSYTRLTRRWRVVYSK